MQRNNGAGGGLRKIVKSTHSDFRVCFKSCFPKKWRKSRLNPVLKSTCIIPQIPI